jgi:microcystin-dependent protein
MGTPFLGELRLFSFQFAPKGWALCNGQLMAINQNQALFALLGTTYGGNGIQTFALPNMQGRCGIHFGNGHTQGESAGEENHTLVTSEMPSHTHTVSCSSGTADQANPLNNLWAQDDADAVLYRNSGGSTMASAAIANTGGSQPHNNMSPFLVMSYCIALQGIFPSRN